MKSKGFFQAPGKKLIVCGSGNTVHVVVCSVDTVTQQCKHSPTIIFFFRELVRKSEAM